MKWLQRFASARIALVAASGALVLAAWGHSRDCLPCDSTA
jgi:hypothetical protein